MKVIELLERLFARQMRAYWYSARETGVKHGVDMVAALIHSEIKVLSKNSVSKETQQRLSELTFILSQMKRII